MCEFSNSSEASAEELFENSHVSPSVVSLKINEAKPNLFLPNFSKNSSLYKDIYMNTPLQRGVFKNEIILSREEVSNSSTPLQRGGFEFEIHSAE